MKKTEQFYHDLMEAFKKLVSQHDLMDETVVINGRPLSNEEAIGTPDRKDFPLLTGREQLMQAEFRESKGQAFTDKPGSFTGTLARIIQSSPENNFERAVWISTMNAVCAYLGCTSKTIHCKNNDPESCASDLITFLNEKHKGKKIALVGYQPSLLERLTEDYPLRVLDLSRDKVGTEQYGLKIEHGIKNRLEVLDWCDLILCTGSTVVNGTLPDYLNSKPVYFYGTTVSGAAALMGLDRFCSRSC